MKRSRKMLVEAIHDTSKTPDRKRLANGRQRYLDSMHHAATSMWKMLFAVNVPAESETACMPITTRSTKMIRKAVDTISSAAR